MKCPLCCEFVPNEELLQDHYLTTCSGLAEESEEDVVLEKSNKKKFQYISPTTPDEEIYFLSTTLDTPQVTLVKVSDDLFQSEEVVVPEGTFEGQLVIGEDVLSVAPFSTAGTIVTLHVTRREFDTWSTQSSKSSTADQEKVQLIERGTLKHSASMSSLSSQSTGASKGRRRRTLSDQSSVGSPKDDLLALSSDSKDNIAPSSDSSCNQVSETKKTMAERTSSKDSIYKPASRRKRRHRRFHADSSTVIHDPISATSSVATSSVATSSVATSSDKVLDSTLVNNDNTISQEKEVQDLKAEISKLRIENRKQAKELSTLSKVIDGPLVPQTEAEIVKRENNELKQELSELRKTMLRQEQSFNKKIGNTRQDPVEDWKKGQIDKLHRQLAEAEQRAEECLAEKLKLEEEVLRGKEKIAQLRETRDTLRSTNESMNSEMKKTTEKLEAEISELHSKYLEQGRELGEAEKLSQSADNMRGLVERLTIENEEVTRQNNQLSLQTAEYEKMIEKLKNKVSSLEIELEYKRKRDAEEEEKKWKKREEDDDLAYLNRRQTSRQHPLIAKSEDSNYKPSVPGQINFNDDDLIASTPYTRKSAPHNTGDTTRKTDYLSSTRNPEHSSDQLLRKPEPSYLKDRAGDKLADNLIESNRRISHSESEFDTKPAVENSGTYDSKYSRPYTKPGAALDEDDTYREALAIVEKYKKLDLAEENSASDNVNNNDKSKPYNNLSNVYDRIKAESGENLADKRRISDKKWSSGLDENSVDVNNLNSAEQHKPWNSTAWLRQQIPDSNYNGTGVSPNRYTSTNGYGSDQIDQMRSTGSTRRYDPATRYPYSGKSYTLPEKNAPISNRVRMRDSDDEADKAEPRATQAPQNINEVQLGSRVVFKRGTDLERGTVRYAGRLVGKDGQYLGIELGNNTGNHDGTYQNHTYFKCKPKRGIFIPINKVQLVYPSV